MGGGGSMRPLHKGAMVGGAYADSFFPQESHGWGAVACPLSCLPFVKKGRCHGVTEGIRKSAFDTANRNAGNQSAKRASLVMHFLPIRNAEHEQERKGTLPHRGKEGGKTAI